jgi:hypothetical protein
VTGSVPDPFTLHTDETREGPVYISAGLLVLILVIVLLVWLF